MSLENIDIFFQAYKRYGAIDIWGRQDTMAINQNNLRKHVYFFKTFPEELLTSLFSTAELGIKYVDAYDGVHVVKEISWTLPLNSSHWPPEDRS